MLYVMTPETVYQRFRKKRITTVTRLEYDKYVYHRPLKLRTDGGYPRVRELGSIDLFVVTSFKMNQLSANFEKNSQLCMEYWLQISTDIEFRSICQWTIQSTRDKKA